MLIEAAGGTSAHHVADAGKETEMQAAIDHAVAGSAV